MDILQFKSQLGFEFTDDKDLLQKLQKEYSADGYTPEIKIEGEVIHIHLDEAVFHKVKHDFEKALDLCNRHEFNKAEVIINNIIKRCPLHSDAHRILAQIKMEQGKLDLAFDSNIESLRIDPTNLYSLLLMGNICMKMRNFEAADKYYQKVLLYHPDNVMALNNIAGNYLQRKEYGKAIEIFNRILIMDDSYLNTYYGLSLAYYNQHNYNDAFETAVKGMKKGVDRPQDRHIREELQKMVMAIARSLTKDFDYSIEIGKQIKLLNELGSKKIEVDRNATKLPVSARLEYSVAHRRDYEKVLVNPTKQYHDHLMMHELMHLQMYLEAKAQGRNKLAVSGETELEAFKKWMNPELGPLKQRLDDKELKEIIGQLHTGLMTQALNSPLDLYVEAMIYRNYPEMRPLQMLSLVDMNLENIESVKKAASSIMPKRVVSVNRIMNIVNAIQLMELYGFNLGPHFKATPAEMRTAKDLYEEWTAYFKDSESKPGDEYELLEYFTQHLGVDEFFTMVNEMHFNDISLPNRDELPKESTDPNVAKEQLESFQEQHKDGADPMETMMMTMYMLGAMKELMSMPQQNVHRIALEIAMVGMTGIKPKKKGYKINALPGREFGGYEFLAYYYVSWAIAIPDKLNDLGLPFSQAYEAALEMYNQQNKKS